MTKDRDTKLVTTERGRNYLVSEPSYYTTKFFTESVLAIEIIIIIMIIIIKTEIIMSKPVYLGLSILELSKILLHEFWYDYIKLKYDEKAKLCYMDTDSFIVYIKKIIFIKVLQNMLKLDLMLQIIN